MVKSPRVKHSSTRSDPVMIDLDPKDVAREKAAEQADPIGPVPEGGMTAPEAAEADISSTGSTAPETPTGSAEDDRPKMGSSNIPPRDGDRFDARPAGDGRRFGALAAGAAGGLAVLLLGSVIQWSGLTGSRTPSNDVTLAEMEAEIASLRQTIDNAPTAPGADQFDALAAEVEALRGQVGSAGEGVDPVALDERLSSLEQAIAAAGSAPTPEAALTAIEERLAALEQRAASVDLEERLAALESRLGDVSQQVEEQAGQPATALIIAASALKAAIDRGQPFMAELETYAALDPDAPQVAELREMAATGVPTRADITSAMAAAADSMVAADRPVDPDAGFWDRIVQSAQDMVVVRPVGVVEGEGTSAVVARLEAAVEAGDYEAALAEYESLPQAAKDAGSDFIAMVRARRSADLLIEQALSAALDQA
jgi:hypothetical protein